MAVAERVLHACKEVMEALDMQMVDSGDQESLPSLDEHLSTTRLPYLIETHYRLGERGGGGVVGY